jgi:hypothetical protein
MPQLPAEGTSPDEHMSLRRPSSNTHARPKSHIRQDENLEPPLISEMTRLFSTTPEDILRDVPPHLTENTKIKRSEAEDEVRTDPALPSPGMGPVQQSRDKGKAPAQLAKDKDFPPSALRHPLPLSPPKTRSSFAAALASDPSSSRIPVRRRYCKDLFGSVGLVLAISGNGAVYARSWPSVANLVYVTFGVSKLRRCTAKKCQRLCLGIDSSSL